MIDVEMSEDEDGTGILTSSRVTPDDEGETVGEVDEVLQGTAGNTFLASPFRIEDWMQPVIE